MKIQTIQESGCIFEFCCDAYIQLDRLKNYRQINYLGLKAVDLVFSNKDEIYFVEIKCYEYFREFLDGQDGKKAQVLVRKLIDSIFFLGVVRTNDLNLKKLRSVLYDAVNEGEKTAFVIMICPICRGSSESRVMPDQIMVVREVLQRKLKGLKEAFNLTVLIDSYYNKLGIFNGVRQV